ncbi:MAG: hypothetical protein JEZ00_14705 [Anaerolineaceae bacterium]|nr:hypothetical protein [Anaerolineaceae bacterium]
MKKALISVLLITVLFLNMSCGLGSNKNNTTNEPGGPIGGVLDNNDNTNQAGASADSLVEVSQWASAATASSEYGSSDWAAYQAVGQPDTSVCADEVTAWASQASDGVDWLEVTFDVPVNPTEIQILQTYSPSQVTEVVVYDMEGAEHNVYKAKPSNESECPYTLSIKIKEAKYQTQRIRITVDQSVLGTSWNEIDAVQLTGMASAQAAAQIQSQPATNNNANSGNTTSSTAPRFFYDELDGALNNLWADEVYYYVSSDTPDDDVNAEPVYNIEQERGSLKFYLQTPWQYVYYLYTPHTYHNVRIDYEVENKGVNSNNIGLVCRYADYGYYEFIATSGGYYSIMRYYEDGSKELARGGIKSIRFGVDKKNTFTAICDENNLYFIVNDVEIASVYDDEISEGLVGLNVSAEDIVPVQVEINWIEISEP